MNTGGVIQSASESVQEVFGWTPAELFGRNVSVLIPEPRRSALDKYLDRYRRADTAKTLHRTRRFDAVRKDGSPVQIELSLSRANIPHLDSPFFVGIIRDVSREIDVGGDSPAERTRLQSIVTEQTRALAKAHLRLQLADRLASLGTLAAGLGHDMSNVLLPIRARLNALDQEPIPPAAAEHLRAIRASVLYLQQLSESLHFLALAPAGTDAEQRDATDLAHWWKQACPLLRRVVPRNITVDAVLPIGLPTVRIDPHWLTQAMLNLVTNAGEAFPANRRAGWVRITAIPADDGATVRLEVTDNGIGMRSEVANSAFDLFYSTKARAMGTGLGLPLVRKVVSLAGGNVEIRSVYGKGTTVSLVLPTVARGAAVAGTAPKERPTAVVTVKDRRIASFISQVLIALGYTVKSVASGGPGTADLWVTKPTEAALTAAGRWRKGHLERALVLLGAPPASARRRWGAIGAKIIDPMDDFEAIRFHLGAASDLQSSRRRSEDHR